ncbi:fish-egg lectin-like, partial [Rhincodon typus]|uniref:fish-egg lectin-like n=1 Tax=Rhincodon typus TaxID=259920 RepID=UPI00202F7A5B
IDAGNGQVFGVNENGSIYIRQKGAWAQVPGHLSHVTVGPAGVWGVDSANVIYRMRGGSWIIMNGLLKQIDAGGNGFLGGVNQNDDVLCVNEEEARSATTPSSPVYNHISGKLTYYSCGLYGCWGVNANNDIYFRSNVTPGQCIGSIWVLIRGKLSMIETGTDGSVYGVNSDAKVFRRDGITSKQPTGTNWSHISIGQIRFKHVTADLGQLWLTTTSNNIIHCQ